MKVLFLDLDGVLNTVGNCGDSILNPDKIELLHRIIDETGIKLVLHSTWRIGGIGPTSNYYKYLKIFDSSDKILNTTIDHVPLDKKVPWSKNVHDLDGDYSVGDEIQWWLDKNQNNIVADKFAILDDHDIFDNLNKYLFKTDMRVGLTSDIANKIIEYFNS